MSNVETDPRITSRGDVGNGSSVEVCPLAGLKVLRAGRGLSLNQAAKAAGMSTAYLQRLERCQIKSPSPHKLAQLAEVLKVEYSYLWELAGYPDPSSPNGTTPPKHDCVSILSTAARSADIDVEDAEILAGVAHELAEAKRVGLDIKKDLLPRVVRSLRKHHEDGHTGNPLDDTLPELVVGTASNRPK
jgi:transcriptional regulator with XRE-family HTH domain